jgi:hypothetical protein
MSFRNRHLHGLLDRQLGLSFLEILADGTRAIGADGNLNPTWSAPARSLRDEFRQFLDGSLPVEMGEIPALRSGRVHYAVVHPFWSVDMVGGALAQVPAGTVLIDSFNLSRRMAWCMKTRDSFPKRAAGARGIVSAPPQTPPTVPPPAPVGTFEHDPAPPGLPNGRRPLFQPVTEGVVLQSRDLYLVRDNENRQVVGRLVKLSLSSDDSMRIRFQPANRIDGLRSFDWAAEERGRVLGRLV